MVEKYFSFGSLLLSAFNLGMNRFIHKNEKKSNRNRMITGGVMVMIAIIVSLANTMQIIKKVEKNRCKQ